MASWTVSWEATPAGADSPALGDDHIRDVKLEVRSRLDQEHMILNTASSGESIHRAGSARVYFQAGEPTLRADGVTSLDSNDDGRLWVDSNNDNTLTVYDGSAAAFEAVTVNPPGDMSIGGDLTVSGSVDCVKNNGDTTLVTATTGLTTFYLNFPISCYVDNQTDDSITLNISQNSSYRQVAGVGSGALEYALMLNPGTYRFSVPGTGNCYLKVTGVYGSTTIDSDLYSV